MQELSVKHLKAFLIIQVICLVSVLVLLAIEHRLILIFNLSTDLIYGSLLFVFSISLIILSNTRQYAKWWLISLNLLGIIITFFTLLFIFEYT
ncbi:MAG: hypothetical protein K0S11_910 [Gammaproteobacteria bacterium]|jgi:hypothetical protein|nr:hypothetical protein [Gammaproteobacteria bacterium]